MLDDKTGNALTKPDAKAYAKRHGLVFVKGNEVLKAWEAFRFGHLEI
jgi:3,4-dihydroxy 2-butanone 4-phosphate synthase